MRPADRPVFLVGFMASGKSTVGRRLAVELDFTFVDTDERVEQREGRSIEGVFTESGEGYFRRVEWECLQELAGAERAVVATGGGLFLGYAQRRFMIERGRTVWLDVPLEVVRRRVEAAPPGARARPLWKPDDPAAWRAWFERRRAAYALAQFRADASGAVGETARELARMLSRGRAGPRPRKPDFR